MCAPASLTYPSNDSTVSSLAVTGRLFDSATNESHKSIANVKNVVFNIHDRFLLSLVHSTVPDFYSITHRACLCSKIPRKSPKNIRPFYSNFLLNYQPARQPLSTTSLTKISRSPPKNSLPDGYTAVIEVHRNFPNRQCIKRSPSEW